ncbi:MAG: hypothetical protein ING75_07585 [Rhodocyclaceae bacterium]|nr:hypothetical protein [Rhodocyclaceae bacterium]
MATRKKVETIHDLKPTEVAMLELLSRGTRGREVAASLGYKEGTARVYLHAMYKRIGVNNKTAAATWYSDRRDGRTQRETIPIVPATMAAFALQHGLHQALGATSVFLGPHSLGETAAPTKPTLVGQPQNAKMMQKTRELWNSFVAGRFEVGKSAFDQAIMAQLFVSEPEGVILLAAHLASGGYSVSAQLARKEIRLKRSAKICASDLEIEALTAMSAAADGKKRGACDRLVEIGDAARKKRNGHLEQLVLVALFHLYRAQGANDKAEAVISTLFNLAKQAAKKWSDAGNAYMPT